MGVQGAALSTTISRAIGTFVLFYIMTQTTRVVQLRCLTASSLTYMP